MSEKRMFKVGYVEYPQSVSIYESLDIDVSQYPELEGMSDDEIMDYIQLNASNMKPSYDEDYSSLYEELRNGDVVREKISRVDSEIFAERINNNQEEED